MEISSCSLFFEAAIIFHMGESVWWDVLTWKSKQENKKWNNLSGRKSLWENEETERIHFHINYQVCLFLDISVDISLIFSTCLRSKIIIFFCNSRSDSFALVKAQLILSVELRQREICIVLYWNEVVEDMWWWLWVEKLAF